MTAPGKFEATFTVTLDKSLADITAKDLQIVYAMGPLGSGGNLSAHTTGNFPYGGTTMSLSSAPGAAPSTEAGTTPGASGPPVSPAAEAPASEAQVRPAETIQIPA